MAYLAGGMGVGVPVHPTETPGGLRVEFQELVVQHLYGHHKHRTYFGTHQFPPSRYKLFNYYRLSSDNVQGVHSNLIFMVKEYIVPGV